ncbi:hypothetical protein EDD86DRAFT_247014 [Gorgonomyces haynaldii]|nr:hypothetical protein EDD86DRAFT_247014 [Gorgonomyces haynaldii]
MKDPLERMAAILSVLLSPQWNWAADKPFNPILGEFISLYCTINGAKYTYDIEQISHHPPVSSYRLCGPSFKLYSPNGIDPAGGFKAGINHVDITFSNQISRLELANGTIIEWNPPGIRIDPLLGKRTVGMHGEIVMKDSSGYKLVGWLKKKLKIQGEGDLLEDGVFFKSSDKIFVAPLKYEPLDVQVDEQYSPNVWQDTFKYMRMDPPDFGSADKEKQKVEQAQRDEAKHLKETNGKFVSRFGFQCKYNEDE